VIWIVAALFFTLGLIGGALYATPKTKDVLEEVLGK
jgi:hypothetical protein